MIDEKKIQEVKANIPRYLEENLIIKRTIDQNIIDFYRKNAAMSLKVAEILFILSTQENAKEKLLLEKDFESNLWVSVCSYYSQFYIANAALAQLGIKIGDKIVHKVTSDCLIFYFITTGKLAKHYLEEYERSMDNALEVMGVDEEKIRASLHQKAVDLIQDFDAERDKRGRLQYKTTTSIKENIAKTSLERAKSFLYEMEQVIAKGKR